MKNDTKQFVLCTTGVTLSAIAIAGILSLVLWNSLPVIAMSLFLLPLVGFIFTSMALIKLLCWMFKVRL